MVDRGQVMVRLLNVGLPHSEEKEDLLISFNGVRFFRATKDYSGPAEVVLTSLLEGEARDISSIAWPDEDRFVYDFGWARVAELSAPGGLLLSSYRALRLSCGSYMAEWLASDYQVHSPTQ